MQQLEWAAKASRNLGLTAHATFSGALAWPFFYPWPQRPAGLIEEAFEELGRRWLPILNDFDEAGVDVCYELHPGEDLHDGVTFERFLSQVNDHQRANILYDPSHMVLQQLDYLEFLDFYHERVRAFHVKDAEFRPNGKSGVYGGLSGLDRPARALPFAGRWAGRFQSDFQQDGAIRLSRLGGAGVGMLHQASKGRRKRRRRSSSGITSSASPTKRLMTSRAPERIKTRIAKSSDLICFPNPKPSGPRAARTTTEHVWHRDHWPPELASDRDSGGLVDLGDVAQIAEPFLAG